MNARPLSAPAKRARLAPVGSVPAEWRGAVVAIGNFDGVHLGHQAVLRAAREEAARRRVAAIMLTLEPHPREFFTGRPLFRLTPAPLKAAAAAAVGLDGVVVLPFNGALAEQSAEQFVRDLLAGQLRISAAVTGYDFHFGKDRRGTPAFLREQGSEHGFAVQVVEPFVDGDLPVSSTRIRAALAQGDVALAIALLGRQFAVASPVIHGEARGRELGYPTANMALDPACDLRHGIYAVRFLRTDGTLKEGVASVGRRPTFDNGAALLETSLFDFSGDLYGETALVSFAGFIRPEERFSSVTELVAHMDRDALVSRTLLQQAPPGGTDRQFWDAWAKLTLTASTGPNRSS